MIEVVTYANKSFGLFEKLVNNPYVNVRVLGWGTKWNGYSDKSKGLLEYLKQKKDDDIVVFVDGFDSEINRPLCDLLSLFKQTNSKVLISKDKHLGYAFFKPFSKQVYGECRPNLIANAGMYMGYAKYLRIMLEDSVQHTCSDDQVVFNRLCKKYPFIRVDEHEVIFKNIAPNQTKQKNEKAIFVSYPGSPTWERYTRAVKEYTQFFYFQLIIALLLMIYLFPKKRLCFLSFMGILTIYVVLFADKTCNSLLNKFT